MDLAVETIGCGRSGKVQKRPSTLRESLSVTRCQATPGSHFVICVSLDDKGKEGGGGFDLHAVAGEPSLMGEALSGCGHVLNFGGCR